MKKTGWILLAVSIAALLPIVSVAHSRNDLSRSTPEWTLYEEECGACHVAYPPGMLPRRSWTALMGGLEDHFGQNAELDADSRQRLGEWLSTWAAESSSHRRSRKILKSLGGAAPLRITDSGWWKHKHEEVSPEVFTRESVSSRANCGACHPDAAQGEFDDDRVKVPRDAPAPR